MLFTSTTFLVFLCIVVIGYYLLGHREQNLWLLAASYVFYGNWSWRFSLLLLGCTAVNYVCGRRIAAAGTPAGRRRWLWIGVGVSLACLGFFKYFNFFADSFTGFAGLFGVHLGWHWTGLILPIGISFYSFQAMSYTIDVYRGKLEPVGSFLDFALFVAFFPQLVAGPIERAAHLLPQVVAPRRPTMDGFLSGLWLILLGCYKKLFVADQLGVFVSALLDGDGIHRGGDVALGLVLFSLQVYADFAGYTDVARGSARLLGFELVPNFRTPYFARNIQDFWNRWHLSLTTWIKDYMFYPMAVSRRWNRLLGAGGMSLVVMMVIGFWHGPSWSFLLWGAYHGVLIHAYLKLRPWLYRRLNLTGPVAGRLWFVACVVFTFSVMTLGEVLFLDRGLAATGGLLGALFTDPHVSSGTLRILGHSLVIVAVPFLLDVDEFRHGAGRESLAAWPAPLRLAVHSALVVSLAYLALQPGGIRPVPYVYFQF